jgi:superfamily II DNA helicase RecQ
MSTTDTQQDRDLASRAHHILRTIFGYDCFRGQQAEIIAQVAGGAAL